jgi:sugar/nucleoside kinase (ribokinase family)
MEAPRSPHELDPPRTAGVGQFFVAKVGQFLVAIDNRIARVPAVGGAVIDTTGAGDAFAAGFAVTYARWGDPLAAARAGAASAGDVVGRLGPR